MQVALVLCRQPTWCNKDTKSYAARQQDTKIDTKDLCVFFAGRITSCLFSLGGLLRVFVSLCLIKRKLFLLRAGWTGCLDLRARRRDTG